MKDFLSITGAIDLALAAIVVELSILLFLGRRSRRGLRPIDLVGQLSAGALLLLAVRTVATNADVRWTLLLLTASFPAHLFDLLRRRSQARG